MFVGIERIIILKILNVDYKWVMVSTFYYVTQSLATAWLRNEQWIRNSFCFLFFLFALSACNNVIKSNYRGCGFSLLRPSVRPSVRTYVTP
jgi:hypothetical protein